MNRVRKIIEKFYGIDISDKSRKRHYVYARFIYYYICYKYLNETYYSVAKSLDKSHASVIWGVKELPYILKYDLKVSQDFKFINLLCKHKSIKIGVSLFDLVNKYNDLLLKFDKLENSYNELQKKLN